VALFFFCGCSWCGEIAKEWAGLQQSGALPNAKGDVSKSSAPAIFPATVVVYSEMEPEIAREMALMYGLNLAQTVVLIDPDMRVTEGVYKADPCPRVFVLDAKGVLRYTNNHPDDQPRKAPAIAIVSRTVGALRAAAPVDPDTRKKSAGTGRSNAQK
jgi:hypothetical protein